MKEFTLTKRHFEDSMDRAIKCYPAVLLFHGWGLRLNLLPDNALSPRRLSESGPEFRVASRLF